MTHSTGAAGDTRHATSGPQGSASALAYGGAWECRWLLVRSRS